MLENVFHLRAVIPDQSLFQFQSTDIINIDLLFIMISDNNHRIIGSHHSIIPSGQM